MSVIVFSVLEYAHAITRWQALSLFLGIVALAFVLARFVGQWYERHYGYVAQREDRLPSQLISVTKPDQNIPKPRSRWLLPFLLLVFALMFFPLLVHSYRNCSSFGLLTLIFFVLPRMSLACTGSISLRVRQMLAVLGGAALILLQLLYDLGRLETWVFVGGSAAVLLVGSLYDHWLLNQLLGGPMEAHDA